MITSRTDVKNIAALALSEIRQKGSPPYSFLPRLVHLARKSMPGMPVYSSQGVGSGEPYYGEGIAWVISSGEHPIGQVLFFYPSFSDDPRWEEDPVVILVGEASTDDAHAVLTALVAELATEPASSFKP